MIEQKEPLCPFSRLPCLEKRCRLWVEMDVTTHSPLAGVAKQNHAELCTFQAILQATVAGVNRPLMVAGPPRRFNA